MPLLDSFCVNHTLMRAPAVRLAKTMTTPRGDEIRVYDLRFCKPNAAMLDARGLHTFEHLFAGFMREFLGAAGGECEVIDISPMGCRTGFYMSVVGAPEFAAIRAAWLQSCERILRVERVPEANVYQCGSADFHSLAAAKEIAAEVLRRGICENKNDEIALSAAELEKIQNGEMK